MGSPCRKYVSTSSHHSFISFYYAPQLLIYLHLGYLLPLQFSIALVILWEISIPSFFSRGKLITL